MKSKGKKEEIRKEWKNQESIRVLKKRKYIVRKKGSEGAIGLGQEEGVGRNGGGKIERIDKERGTGRGRGNPSFEKKKKILSKNKQQEEAFCKGSWEADEG